MNGYIHKLSTYFTRRIVLIVVTIAFIVVVSVGLRDWIGTASERNTLINEIEQLGARVAEIRSSRGLKQSEPPRMYQWLQQIVGKRAFDGPLDITINSAYLEAIIPKVCRLKNVDSLTVMKDDLDESEIECLSRLKTVPKITLVTFRDNAARVRCLKSLLPQATIRDPFADPVTRGNTKGTSLQTSSPRHGKVEIP